jgi:predicted metal-dependent hydrolase
MTAAPTPSQMDFLSDPSTTDVGPGDDAAPRVRVSGRARRLSIRVYPDARVEVVVPPRVRPREIELFVATHREWIEEKREHAIRQRPAPQPFPPERIELRATGELFRVRVAGGTGRLRIAIDGDGGAGPGERMLRVSGRFDRSTLRRALRVWVMESARERLTPRVATLAEAAGVPYARVAIRRQRSRWGSCSSRGTISLNACLLFQRPEVVDYLIVHELMHVRHMNHSARFWQSVERHCAGWRALDRELLQGWRWVPRWVFSDEN